MVRLELKQIYLQLEHEINCLSQSKVALHRQAIKEDMQHVVTDLKSDIDEWIFQLNERSISCYELEQLLESKRELIDFKELKKIGINEEEFEAIQNDFLRCIAKSIFDCYLNTLFKNPKGSTFDGLKKVNWF